MADQTDNRTAEEQEQERDEMLRQLLATPPQPRPKRERAPQPEYLVVNGKLRVAGNVQHHDDGSITADVYRNLEDYRAGEVMERAATFSG